jgi:hypothetical protein
VANRPLGIWDHSLHVLVLIGLQIAASQLVFKPLHLFSHAEDLWLVNTDALSDVIEQACEDVDALLLELQAANEQLRAS